jgi:hypothetical protein
MEAGLERRLREQLPSSEDGFAEMPGYDLFRIANCSEIEFLIPA